VDRYHWLLFLHVAGAFLVIGGATMAAIFSVAALRRERPSEIADLFKFAQLAAVAVMIGMTVALVFGLWLVADVDFAGWRDTWVILALVLWVVANGLGSAGGRRDKGTRELAQRLATQGDQPSTELRTRLRDPLSLGLSYASGVVVLVILALMMWKPGS